MKKLAYTLRNAGISHFIVLHFTAIHRYGVPYKVKVGGNSASSKYYQHQFFPQLCSFHIYHILVKQCSKLFHHYYFHYGDLQSVIFDVTVCDCVGGRKPCLFKITNLIDKFVVTAPRIGHSQSLPLLRPPYSTRLNNIEIRPNNNPTMASQVFK